ncbi:MAG: ISKra4 family transposase, partial [Pseudonocardiaceae bacterium]
MGAYAPEISGGAFGQSRERFEALVCWLEGQQAQELTHGELETRLQDEGRELLRALTQDHLDLRAQQEPRLAQVVGADGVRRAHAETGRTREVATVFGPVTLRRLTYRQPGHAGLHPAEAMLNLPAEKYSHGL